MDFLAVDVETANADIASICQIGIVSFQGNKIIKEWGTLVNPDDFFDPFNIEIHGIDAKQVINAPHFPNILSLLKDMLGGQIVVSHMPFDRLAIMRASEKYELEVVQCRWLDSARIARRAWTKFAYSGYGLANLASEFGIVFRRHSAVEDARVAGQLVVKAIQETGISLNDWLTRVQKPIFMTTTHETRISKTGNPDGSLCGENVVFTGALSIPRREAADLAAQAGCNVDSEVKQSTTILIVGQQAIRKLAGHEKSSKHRRAEDLIREGHKIQILGEEDFWKLVTL